MALRRRCFACCLDAAAASSTSGVICNQLLGCSRRCSRFAISHALRYRFLAICCCHAAGGARPPAVRTTAQPYTAGRLPFFVTAVRKSASEVPLRFIDAHRYAPDIVRSQPRTASLLSGNSVLLADFFRRRLTPPRLASVFQRFCAGRARGEPPAMLPAARVRRQWFMTAEEGVRRRISLF